MIPMRAVLITGKLINMGRVNVGAVHQHVICSNAFACGLLTVGAISTCRLILTNTMARQEHSQLLFVQPAVLGLCVVLHFCGFSKQTISWQNEPCVGECKLRPVRRVH